MCSPRAGAEVGCRVQTDAATISRTSCAGVLRNFWRERVSVLYVVDCP